MIFHLEALIIWCKKYLFILIFSKFMKQTEYKIQIFFFKDY